MFFLRILSLVVLQGFNAAFAEGFTPKYGPALHPHATLLRESRKFIKSSSAPDFWALMPYYEGMRGEHSASAASVVAVLNGFRQKMKYSSSDELVTEENLLKKVTAEDWAAQLAGAKPKGVTLNQMGKIVASALTVYGVEKHSVELVRVPGSDAKSLAQVRKILIENERSDQNFIIAHYIQSAFTGDPEGAVGTYSPIGAFDHAKDQVLIFETDRKYYEPYWVSLKTFVAGLSDLKNPDSKETEGGLLWIH